MACLESDETCITQGNDWFYDLTLTRISPEDNTTVEPLDITGATVELDLKETIEGAVIISPTIVISDPTTGEVSFSLTAAQTQTLITEPSDTGNRKLVGAPRITYQDGTVEDLYLLNVDIHQSWND